MNPADTPMIAKRTRRRVSRSGFATMLAPLLVLVAQPFMARAAMIVPPGAQPVPEQFVASTDASSAVPGEEPLPDDKLKRILHGARGAQGFPGAQAILDTLFDYEYIARWSAGRLDGALDDAQREALLGAVREQLLDRISGYLGIADGTADDIALAFLEPRHTPQAPGLATVPVEATMNDGKALITLEFRMYLSRSGWKAYDVTANGASATAFFRQYYGDLIRRHGPEVFSP